MTAAATTTSHVPGLTLKLESPATKKFHELNPEMLSSKILKFHAIFQPFCMGLYVLANILFPLIPFIIDYAISCQAAVVNKIKSELKSKNSLIGIVENKIQTVGECYAKIVTLDKQLARLKEEKVEIEKRLDDAQALLEEGKTPFMSAKSEYMPDNVINKGEDF
jgi:cell shape-determining protein MreC